jgi:hypothetical protein
LVCFIIYLSVLVSADFLGDILKKELPQLPGAGELPIGQAAGKGGSLKTGEDRLRILTKK